jgi:hypothetical protein
LHILKNSALVLLAAFLMLYLGDAVVLRIRVQRGSGLGSVQVNQFLATPLKGQKIEYDAIGTVPVTCTRSIFPQMGNPTCWWLERHTAQWQ